MTEWTVPDQLTISCATGPMTVRCYASGVPGLVIHRAPGNEKLETPLWVLAHAPSGWALATDSWCLGRGEAELAAEGLRELADWTRPIDAGLDVRRVMGAFDRAFAWREGTEQTTQDLVWHIGDRVIGRCLESRCDGDWHRIRIGWGETFVQLSTARRPAGEVTVFHFSATRTIASEGRVWSYEEARFDCMDCGLAI